MSADAEPELQALVAFIKTSEVSMPAFLEFRLIDEVKLEQIEILISKAERQCSSISYTERTVTATVPKCEDTESGFGGCRGVEAAIQQQLNRGPRTYTWTVRDEHVSISPEKANRVRLLQKRVAQLRDLNKQAQEQRKPLQQQYQQLATQVYNMSQTIAAFEKDKAKFDVLHDLEAEIRLLKTTTGRLEAEKCALQQRLKSIASMPCRYGAACKKKAEGCPFRHLCRYDEKCLNSRCNLEHPRGVLEWGSDLEEGY